MYGQEFYNTLDFTVEVTGSEQCVTLTPVLLADTLDRKILVGSFLIDGIEIIGSSRIVLDPGKKEHPFSAEGRIHRPVLYEPEKDPFLGCYIFTLRLYQAGAVCCELEKKAFFPAQILKGLPGGEKIHPLFTDEKSNLKDI